MWFFTKTDPICGMKEEQGQGTTKYNKWFCSFACLKKYEKQLYDVSKKPRLGSCH